MADIPYTQVPGKLKALLAKIREVGVPQKANNGWLDTLGFKSSNDRTMIGVLKHIGMLDSNSSPTNIWREFRGQNYKIVLADAIRNGYSTFFEVYPDAHARPNSDIEHVVSGATTSGKQVISKIVNTFKTLVGEADFSKSSIISEKKDLAAPSSAPQSESIKSKTRDAGAIPSLHVDVQIHIAPEATVKQIDQIFLSMSKHLYGHK